MSCKMIPIFWTCADASNGSHSLLSLCFYIEPFLYCTNVTNTCRNGFTWKWIWVHYVGNPFLGYSEWINWKTLTFETLILTFNFNDNWKWPIWLESLGGVKPSKNRPKFSAGRWKHRIHRTQYNSENKSRHMTINKYVQSVIITL